MLLVGIILRPSKNNRINELLILKFDRFFFRSQIFQSVLIWGNFHFDISDILLRRFDLGCFNFVGQGIRNRPATAADENRTE